MIAQEIAELETAGKTNKKSWKQLHTRALESGELTLAKEIHKKYLADRHFTPDSLATHCVYTLIAMASDRSLGTALEPHAGEGVFTRALEFAPQVGPVTSIDLHPGFDGCLECDFLKTPVEEKFDLIVGNPPFEDAHLHVVHAYNKLSDHGIMGFILPLNMLCGVKRSFDLWPLAPLTMCYAMARRPRFSGAAGTGKQDCAFFVWDKTRAGSPPQVRTGW